MTRLQMKNFLVSQGITEPTSEQIDACMNMLNGEVQKEKTRADQFKRDLDELNSANLSDIERANKETEAFKVQVAELQETIATMNTKNSLLANGIKEDEAEKLIESLNSGSFDASIIGAIIADRTKNAVADFEKKALEGTPNPNGKGGEPEAEKTEMDKAVEIAKSAIAGESKSADIISAYA